MGVLFETCRSLGHQWDWDLKSIRSDPPNVEIDGQCLRCTSTAVAVWKRNGGRVRRKIRYVDGYLQKRDETKRVLVEYRLMVIEDALAQARKNATNKKGRR